MWHPKQTTMPTLPAGKSMRNISCHLSKTTLYTEPMAISMRRVMRFLMFLFLGTVPAGKSMSATCHLKWTTLRTVQNEFTGGCLIKEKFRSHFFPWGN